MIFLDFETRSRCDLPRRGGHVYAADPSSEVVCGVALDVRSAPAIFYVWSQFPGPLTAWKLRPEWLEALKIDASEISYAPPLLGTDELPATILRAAEEGTHFCAHNAWGFDEHIWNECGLPRTTWVDSIPLCQRRGLPAKLESVGQALFNFGKDRAGARVMQQSMRPMSRGRRKGEFLDPDGPRLSAIVRYCVRDVALMAQAFFEELSDPHVDDPVLEAHREIDARGVAVDLPLARLLLAVDQASALAEAAEAERLTGGAVSLTTLRSPVALVAWLKAQGVNVENVQAPTVRERIKTLDHLERKS